MRLIFNLESRSGSILLYALLLSFLGTIVATVLVRKSEVLVTNYNVQTVEERLNRNIETKADLAIKYDNILSSDGSGFTDTRSCPNPVTLFNSSSGSVAFSGASNPWYGSDRIIRCLAESPVYGNIVLSYASDYLSFSGAEYESSDHPLFLSG